MSDPLRYTLIFLKVCIYLIKKDRALLSKGKAFQLNRWALCCICCFWKTNFNLWFILSNYTCWTSKQQALHLRLILFYCNRISVKNKREECKLRHCFFPWKLASVVQWQQVWVSLGNLITVQKRPILTGYKSIIHVSFPLSKLAKEAKTELFSQRILYWLLFKLFIAHASGIIASKVHKIIEKQNKNT